jgi:predicted phage-related endonuclease
MADLGDRTKYLGWSEVGTVLGMDPYKSAYQLAREKLGLDERDQGETRAAAMGHLLEPVIGQLYTRETGRPAVAGGEVVHPDYPWLKGHPDFLVETPAGEPTRYLEAKATRVWEGYGEEQTSDVPKTVFCQCIAGCTIMGLDLADVGVMRRPTTFELFYVMRDDELWAEMLPKLVEFWGYIEKGELPEPETLEDLQIAFPEEEKGIFVPYHQEMEDDLHRYIELRTQRAAIDEEMKVIKNNYLTMILQDNAEGIADVEGRPLVTYKATKGRLNGKALEKDHPALAGKYRGKVGPRTFKITKAGESVFGIQEAT